MLARKSQHPNGLCLLTLCCLYSFFYLAVRAGRLGSHQLGPSNFSRLTLNLHGLSIPQDEASLRKAEKHLRRLNKRSVHSIQSPDGDTIDCILREEQPAFEHPLLKNHKIQEPPTHLLPRNPARKLASDSNLQLWRLNGSCPVGTIPVRRTSINDLLRVTAPESYGRKRHGAATVPRSANAAMESSGHEHAIAYVEGKEYYGAKAVINVWEPNVEVSDEFSLSQIWVLGGSFGDDLNSIEAGWQVSPQLYGDSRSRLFTYWTSDAYQETGCYNLLCSGFIQINDFVAIGAAISPVSTYGGSQYEIEIMIWKDPREGNWWMVFDHTTIVGYWPCALFSHLSDHATMVQWGGEVVNSKPSGFHTSTQMGSGRFAEEGYGSASFFHSLQVVDASNSLQPVNGLKTLAEHPNCYDVKSLNDANWGATFYYGGPGRTPLCS